MAIQTTLPGCRFQLVNHHGVRNVVQKLPYYKPSFFSYRTWTKVAREQGCTEIANVCLASDQPPPLVRDLLLPAKAAPAKPKVESNFLLDLILFLDRLAEPGPTPAKLVPPKPASAAPDPKLITVEPFDIQKIPDVMDKLGMKNSAKVMRKWFAGELNYSIGDENNKNAINQHAQPFPPNMVDTTTVKLDWVLKYVRAQEKFDELLRKKIENHEAIKKLKEILVRPSNLLYNKNNRYPNTPYTLDAWELSGQDIQKLHKEFQFQFIGVDTTKYERGKLLIRPTRDSSLGASDDLFGTLGGFYIYAAIDEVEYERTSDTTARASITQISVYVKDSFNFFDKTDERGSKSQKSQYLGHWGYGGMRLVPSDLLYNDKSVYQEGAYEPGWCQFPVYTDSLSKYCVFYPVFNADFRSWQMKYKQGGDLLLFSDREVVWLLDPIVVELEL